MDRCGTPAESAGLCDLNGPNPEGMVSSPRERERKGEERGGTRRSSSSSIRSSNSSAASINSTGLELMCKQNAQKATGNQGARPTYGRMGNSHGDYENMVPLFALIYTAALVETPKLVEKANVG